MNQEFVLKTLADVMGWDDDRSRREFAWLGLMSQIKYDGYQDFLAGMRFIESLVDWLLQFEPAERETAYQFVRRALVYVSPAEMAHLVELFYPETVQRRLLRETASRLGIKPYQVWSSSEAEAVYRRLLRQTLFIELSDGARIDIFRRANAGLVSNEQIVTAPRIIRPKWDELRDELRTALGDPKARFAFVYLVDDFIGSGMTLLRENQGEWKGKLPKFRRDLEEAQVMDSHFEPDWQLCVHHYLATYKAGHAVDELQAKALAAHEGQEKGWFKTVEFSCGMELPENFPVSSPAHADFLVLVEKYYDDAIETKSMQVGGDDSRLGFAKCALPLILDHNTPNNSIALLWAETPGGPGKHAMRPLFRRRQRHL